jgi:hypothetical protein
MNWDPEKFFIGLMDFFSILLPGALLSYLLMDDLGPVLLPRRFCTITGTEGWAVFLFASYLFGHFVFLLSSSLDGFYDLLRRCTLNKQIWTLARRGYLLPWPVRVLSWLVFKSERDLAQDRAIKIKESALARFQIVGCLASPAKKLEQVFKSGLMPLMGCAAQKKDPSICVNFRQKVTNKSVIFPRITAAGLPIC